jgi:hypothetical protein
MSQERSSSPSIPAESERYQTFEAFFPFYLGEHRSALNRWLHFFGTSLGVFTVVYALLSGQYGLLPAAPVVGYGCAWIGHFFIEKNKPASFKYPLWSLIGDFKMYALMVRGKL